MAMRPSLIQRSRLFSSDQSANPNRRRVPKVFEYASAKGELASTMAVSAASSNSNPAPTSEQIRFKSRVIRRLESGRTERVPGQEIFLSCLEP